MIAAFDGGAITSQAGALLLRQTGRAIGLSERLASRCIDHREGGLTVHGLPVLVGQRIVAIALGHEVLDDHGRLRHDPVPALLADGLRSRRSDCAALAGKSTPNRLEHAPEGAPGRYLRIGHDGAVNTTMNLRHLRE